MSVVNAKRIIIVGAGGNAKVILDSLNEITRVQKDVLEIIGFLDDDSSKNEMNGLCRLGDVAEIAKFCGDDNTFFVDAIGNNEFRKKLMQDYPDARWYTVIHPTAIISPFVKIGDGSIVMPRVIINSGTTVGKKCLINTGTIIEHDNVLGDFVHLASGTTTAGDVTICECTLVGTGTSILRGSKIGANCTIGVGATVINDIPDACTAVGVPAKVINE